MPIGYPSAGSFRSTYDGNGHIISGLFINRPMGWDLGLFGETSSSVIKNLGIVDADITGRYNIGALVGDHYFNSTISNCYTTGNITGNENYIGGLVGYNDNSSIITHSYSTCNVTSTGSYVGGVAGSNTRGSLIYYSHSRGDVKGDNYVGGLTGYNKSSIINCYSTDSVSGGEYYTGGSDDYQGYYVGGLVGDNAGGIVNQGFWDINMSGATRSDSGEGICTWEMTFQELYTDWDFTETWEIEIIHQLQRLPSIQTLSQESHPFPQEKHQSGLFR